MFGRTVGWCICLDIVYCLALQSSLTCCLGKAGHKAWRRAWKEPPVTGLPKAVFAADILIPNFLVFVTTHSIVVRSSNCASAITMAPPGVFGSRSDNCGAERSYRVCSSGVGGGGVCDTACAAVVAGAVVAAAGFVATGAGCSVVGVGTTVLVSMLPPPVKSIFYRNCVSNSGAFISPARLTDASSSSIRGSPPSSVASEPAAPCHLAVVSSVSSIWQRQKPVGRTHSE